MTRMVIVVQVQENGTNDPEKIAYYRRELDVCLKNREKLGFELNMDDLQFRTIIHDGGILSIVLWLEVPYRERGKAKKLGAYILDSVYPDWSFKGRDEIRHFKSKAFVYV